METFEGMKLLRAYLFGLVFLGLPSYLLYLQLSGNIYGRFALAISNVTHTGQIAAPDQTLVTSPIPAKTPLVATATAAANKKSAPKCLRVPSVDELCTNPHINDELSGIYSTFQWKSSEHLPRMLTEDQTQMMHEFLHSVMRAFCDLKIEWMIYYGSLLGAYITHDALPWDDDLDLILEERALRILAVEHKNGMLSARYNISYVITGGLHKLYWSPGKKIKPYSWAWPFMDIIAYNKSKESFSNLDIYRIHRFKAQLDWVYPLHMRPFGPVWVPAPRDPWRMMGLTYKKGMREFVCSEPHYDHIRERGRKGAKKNSCKDLHGDYRFVYREPKSDGGLIETLKLGDETLYSIEYDEPFYEDVNPYKWKMMPF
ncbi:hypothetical protein CAPTEDRAFT_211109 [Capitella teleta]|uniref:LicD/FKTN/FKRP nucleotidyltransferase domain-containing protein n=1 Tax=Capitella teleta TaxID=283909 RepID=R7TW73_CAPTE|nr:hypothetical protein CAPTEDRAFT_211109 [Capitella teleta]|eukprot:ELT95240.1 hypothetical protein CAPTEDRAFT_211109 [Capitella teleta]